MEFVDRKDETARLKASLETGKNSLVVLYGRRRLGKSSLIERVLSERDVYYNADHMEAGYQRASLARVLANVFPGFDNATYHNWDYLLRAVNYRVNGKFTLCIDEFPYLVSQSPELPSVLQRLVDTKELKYNLVLCGSSQSMMYGLFLGAEEPTAVPTNS